MTSAHAHSPSDFAKALAALDTFHSALLDDVANARRVFWLGSGISWHQAPRLAELIRRVLLYLKSNGADIADDPHTVALTTILSRRFPQQFRIDYDANPRSWEVPSAVDLEPYEDKYASILAQTVGNERADYLLWNAVDICATYGGDDIVPGETHLLIAMLMHEGNLPSSVTTNWDGLIEAAYDSLARSNRPNAADIAVMMTKNDFRANAKPGAPKLFKIHGCAIRASESLEYRDYLVAQTLDIATWGQVGDPHNRAFQAVAELMTDFKTLILGLSFQDEDLVRVHSHASNQHPWSWDANDPAYVISDEELKDGHKVILQSSYGNDYASNRSLVETASHIPMFAEPLLTALLLRTIILKIQALAGRLVGLEEGTWLRKALFDAMESRLAQTTGSAGKELSSSLISFQAKSLSPLIHRYHGDEDPTDGYAPLYHGAVSDALTDSGPEQARTPEVAAMLALLNYLDLTSEWIVRIETDSTRAGMILLQRPGGLPARMILAKDEKAAIVAMRSDEWRDPTHRTIVARLTGTDRPPAQRSPAGKLGSARRPGAQSHEVAFADIWQRATSARVLSNVFSQKVTL